MKTIFDDEKRFLGFTQVKVDRKLLQVDIEENLKEDDYLNVLRTIRTELKEHQVSNVLVIDKPSMRQSRVFMQHKVKLWERIAYIFSLRLALSGVNYEFENFPCHNFHTFTDKETADDWLLSSLPPEQPMQTSLLM